MRSIRFKIVALFLALIMGTFIIISGLLFAFLGNYYTKREGTTLLENAKRISTLTSEVLIGDSNFSSDILKRIYTLNIENTSQSLGAYIIVFNKEGKIVTVSSSSQNLLKDKELPKSLTESVLSGNSINQINDFGGLLKSSALVAGVPIEYQNTSIGGVFCVLSMPYLDELRFDVLYMIFMAMLAAFVLAVILAYLFAKKLTRPILQISEASRVIAGGNFEKRVNISMKDEIGELAINFNNMAESLQNLEDMRSSFIANVSHELRTPMTIILGFLEGISDGIIGKEKHQEYINIVVDEVRRLSRLVNDLLDVARIESGTNKISPIGFNINEQIRLGVLKFENSITAKEINVVAEFENEKSLVYADIDAIDRVITNLIDNAVKFANTGGEIKINVYSRGNLTYICVENTGDGISPEDLKYLWDRFYKTDKSRSADKKGVGLGLYIVKNIINQHDGQIIAECEIGKYTRFTFSLPTYSK